MSIQVKKNGSVRFAFMPEQSVQKVAVAGSFNGWQPEPMRKQKSGEYVRNLDLPVGTHEYKFVIDGNWQHDLDNDACSHNTMGTVNSVVTVK